MGTKSCLRRTSVTYAQDALAFYESPLPLADVEPDGSQARNADKVTGSSPANIAATGALSRRCLRALPSPGGRGGHPRGPGSGAGRKARPPRPHECEECRGGRCRVRAVHSWPVTCRRAVKTRCSVRSHDRVSHACSSMMCPRCHRMLPRLEPRSATCEPPVISQLMLDRRSASR